MRQNIQKVLGGIIIRMKRFYPKTSSEHFLFKTYIFLKKTYSLEKTPHMRDNQCSINI